MKTKNLLVTLLAVICFINVALSQQSTFQKAYGGTSDEIGNSVQQTTDGGYILVGSTISFGVQKGHTDVYLIKTDVNGDTIWTKTFGGDGWDAGFSVRQTSDLGYIVAGHTNSFGNGAYDVYLIRTDMNGNMLWSKTYGGALDDYGYDVKQTTDGGFIITGKTLNFGVKNSDVYLLKTDGAGNLLWTKTFGTDYDDIGYSVQQTRDGSYIVGGVNSKGGFYLIKTSSAGDSLWTRTSYAGTTPHINVAQSVQQTADDGYIMAGYTYPFHFFLIKTASDGTTQWSKTYGGTNQDYGTSVRQTTDGGYIIGGITGSFPVGSGHSLLIRIDAAGDLVWAKTYKGGGTSPLGYMVEQTADGGFIFLGNASGAGFGAGLRDMYLVKTDENGNSGNCNQGDASPAVISVTTTSKPSTNVGSGGTVTSPLTIVGRGCTVTALCSTVGTFDIINNSSLTAYPNPFNNELIIKGTKQDGVIILYDINGKEIKRTPTYDGDTKLYTQPLTSGLYLLKYLEGNNSKVITLVKY